MSVTGHNPNYIPLRDGNNSDRHFEQFITTTQSAVIKAVRRYLPEADLTEPAATAVLTDSEFENLFLGRVPDNELHLVRGTYLVGGNVVVLPRQLDDMSQLDKTERMTAQAIMTEEYLHGITTRPMATPTTTHAWRTGFNPSALENESILEPGRVFKFIGAAALTGVTGELVKKPDFAARRLTEAATKLAVNLLLEDITKSRDYPYLIIQIPGGNWPASVVQKNAALTSTVLAALYTGDANKLDIPMPVSVIDERVGLKDITKPLRTLLVHRDVAIYSSRYPTVPEDLKQFRKQAFSYHDDFKVR